MKHQFCIRTLRFVIFAAAETLSSFFIFILLPKFYIYYEILRQQLHGDGPETALIKIDKFVL